MTEQTTCVTSHWKITSRSAPQSCDLGQWYRFERGWSRADAVALLISNVKATFSFLG